MTLPRRELLPWLLIAACWAITLYYWPRLPDPMPTHWGIDGQPNGWMPRAIGALVGPLMAILLYVVSSAVDPRVPDSRNAAGLVKTVILGFCVFITYLVDSVASAPTHAMHLGVLWAALGMLTVFLGAAMPGLKPNRWMGIRTPRTLSSEAVWTRTHRMAGPWMMGCGVLLMVSALLPEGASTGLAVGALLAVGAGPIAYSYMVKEG